MNKELIDPTARIATEASIADLTWVGPKCEIGAQVQIGGGVILGPRVRMIGEVVLKNEIQIAEDVILVGPLMIEDRCRIGAGARIGTGLVARTIILKGCSIGRGAMIDSGLELNEYVFVKARTHVAGSVPAHALVGGSPAAIMDFLCGCGGDLAVSGNNGLVSNFACQRCGCAVPLSRSDIQKRGRQILPDGELGRLVSTRAWWSRWNESQDL